MRTLLALRVIGIGYALITLLLGPYPLMIGATFLVACELMIVWVRHGSAAGGGPVGWVRRRFGRPPRRRGVPAYVRVVEALQGAAHSRFDFDYQLRPMLTDAAAVRLEENHGIDLYADPDAARVALGDEAWALLDPGRERTRSRSTPGLDERELAQLIARVEAL